MKLTPVAIKGQQFAKRFRGCDENEVQAFLEIVAATVESYSAQALELTTKVKVLEAKLQEYQNIEQSLHNTLLQAQETGGRAIENARKEAQQIIDDATVKASQLVEQSKTELVTISNEISSLNSKKQSMISRLKTALMNELDIIKALESNGQSSSPKDFQQEQFVKERMQIENIIKNLDTKL